MIAEEKIAEIRQAARISEFISPHVALKRRGRNLTGLCPFHEEKTPSFSVDDERGFYHCFGCGTGGNVFKFLMAIEGLSFPEAVRKVAERYGIDVPEQGGAKAAPSRDRYYHTNASAARYFRRCLLETPAGRPVLDYLSRRGVGDEVAETYLLGASPTSGDGLVRWLRKEGIDASTARELGLLVERGGALQDRFRGRLMFPIRDAQGRVVGFAGRSIGDDAGPKYLNSAESPVYHKSRVLYGLFEAREALRSVSTLILVEGYLDAIALRQAGVASVAATCGTALTAEQARMIRRQADEVIVVFDGDGAGTAAAARSFPVFTDAGLWPKMVVLPAGEDPDSFVRASGLEAFEQCLDRAVPLVDAFVEFTAQAAGGGPSGAARAAAELSAVLARLDNPFERDVLIRKAALWTGISEDVLRRQASAETVRSRPTRRPPALPGAKTPGGAPGPEELLVTLMLTGDDVVRRVHDEEVFNLMVSPVWKPVAAAMIDRLQRGLPVDPGATLEEIPEQYRQRVAGRLVEGAGFDDAETRERVLADCIRGIRRSARRRHNESLLLELRRREELGAEVKPGEELAGWKPRNLSDA